MSELSQFCPNWISPPGDTIRDILSEKNISITSFARGIGASLADTKALLDGQLAVTLRLARALESELGASVEFWMSRDFHYRQTMTRLDDSEARDWIRELPIQEMVRFGWMPPARPSERVAACLRFFGVPDFQSWRQRYGNLLQSVAFRTSASFESQAASVAAWLRQGEVEAQSIKCKPWNPRAFSDTLQTIRKLTRKKDPKHFIPELQNACSDDGVAVVVLRAPSGCRASGATHFLSNRKAVLQLSFRYLADDQFWFSFFHEAGHLLLHGGDGLFLEGADTPQSTLELEANQFAERCLIPLEYLEQLLKLRSNSKDVIAFAQKIGVAPGIIVGQLQHYRTIPRSHLNSLKRRYTWTEE